MGTGLLLGLSGLSKGPVSYYALLLPFAMTGCQKKAAFPTCKDDADCRVDASGAEINGVCYMGKCEECSKDEDCKDLKQCVENRCLSSCQADADCGADKHCENSFCIADCTGNESCPGSHVCATGRCVAEGAAGEIVGECKILPIHFDFDRQTIRPEDKAAVDRLGDCLKKNPGARVTIEGHADNRGTPSYNIALGQRRADAVQKYLRDVQGIASNRIKTHSYGEQRPVSDENTEDGWQQNRRAEFVLGQN